MPVEAFQLARKGNIPIAIVPTIFAERADGRELTLVYPEEGAAYVPSFVAVRSSLDKEVADKLLSTLFAKEFLDFYVSNGIEPCIEYAEDTGLVAANRYAFLV
jgi:ABC-type Fe3+ transport system substrate-binding protein